MTNQLSATIAVVTVLATWTYGTVEAYSSAPDQLSESFLGGLMRWYANDEAAQQATEDFEDRQPQQLLRVAKEFSGRFQPRMDDLLLAREPSLRDQEYLEHSSLWGHQYVQGGAGEGHQHLKPDGSIKNIQVIKTDAALPAYCNPPNPCPPGYTGEDGCLEEFVNTAAFSREYQAGQECMCDAEHMFDCPGGTEENELDTLARSLSNHDLSDHELNQFVDTLASGSAGANGDDDHKVVAKKFFSKKNHDDYLDSLRKTASGHGTKAKRVTTNPYLAGEKLPVIAKKSPKTSGSGN